MADKTKERAVTAEEMAERLSRMLSTRVRLLDLSVGRQSELWSLIEEAWRAVKVRGMHWV